MKILGTFSAMTLAALTSCTYARAHPRLTTAFVASAAMIACDSVGTMRLSGWGRWDIGHEQNPMLGEHPGMVTLIAAGVAAMVVNYAVYRLDLPTWIRAAWFGGAIAAESAILPHNYPGAGMCGLGVPAPPGPDAMSCDPSIVESCVRDHRAGT